MPPRRPYDPYIDYKGNIWERPKSWQRERSRRVEMYLNPQLPNQILRQGINKILYYHTPKPSPMPTPTPYPTCTPCPTATPWPTPSISPTPTLGKMYSVFQTSEQIRDNLNLISLKDDQTIDEVFNLFSTSFLNNSDLFPGIRDLTYLYSLSNIADNEFHFNLSGLINNIPINDNGNYISWENNIDYEFPEFSYTYLTVGKFIENRFISESKTYLIKFGDSISITYDGLNTTFVATYIKYSL